MGAWIDKAIFIEYQGKRDLQTLPELICPAEKGLVGLHPIDIEPEDRVV